MSREPCVCGRAIVWRFGRFYSCNDYVCQKRAQDAYYKELDDISKAEV